MRRKRTRKQWYEYHRDQAQLQGRSKVESEHREEIQCLRGVRDDAREAYFRALKAEPLSSKLRGFFDFSSEYRSATLLPLREDLDVANRALRDALDRLRALQNQAEKAALEEYEAARAQRQVERFEREERAARRRYEMRLRYLEESPALRSASRSLKEHLIRDLSEDGESITCFYCEQRIPIGESHLEHKRPLSRGGTNARGNLALSCATCNLRKGRKTHEEFLRQFGGRPLTSQ
ncbi:MAG: hypothetical protein GC151_07920 [Betaproteobacteria bacterium]|nr:hypothetical protein [Betaproteobacteria bacterium]